MKTAAILVVLFLILITGTAFAGEQPVGAVAGSQLVQKITTTVFVEPNDIVRQGKIPWLNEHNFLVYSRRSRGSGDQVDFVRKGNFGREIRIVCDGHMEMIKCGNLVYMLEVEIEQRVYTPKAAKYVCLPSSSPPTSPSPPAAPTVNNYYTFNTVPVGSYQIGGVQPPVVVSTALGSVGWIRPSNVTVSVSSSANAPATITNTNTLSQSQQQQQQQQQDVAVDP